MAAAPRLPLRLLLLRLLLLLLAPPAAPHAPGPAGRGRRFSELKVCADRECSMLMYRGEALEDFEGPDCRFVNFKKGDTVYVYYKLAGISPEVWAGSVGQAFGYFPKDLIHVAFKYTKEELHVPADETDFVCFSGGRDDFTNYNLEDLLAYLELPSPATGGHLEEATAKASQHVEPPAEESEDHGPQPSTDSSSEGSSPGVPGSAPVPEDSRETPPSSPQADTPMEHAQGAPSSSESFEAVRPDELQAPSGQNNRTSNSSQGPGEQLEKMDAYKLLKQEMALDLQTKFGSTTDVLVSDDETTKLVTSSEDELDEDLEAEYYMAEQEEEEEDGVEDLPLLTFGHGTDGADGPSPGRTGVEGGAVGQESNSSEEDSLLPAPGGTADGGQRPRDEVDSGAAQHGDTAGRQGDHLSAEDADSLPATGSRRVDPLSPSVPELTGRAGAAGALGIRGVLQASKAKASHVDTNSHVPGKVGSERGTVPGKTEAEHELPPGHGVSPPGTALGSQQRSGSSARQGEDAVLSDTASKDRDPWGAAVHVSKEESGGEPTQAGGPRMDGPLSGLKDEEEEMEAPAIAPVPGENQQGKDGVPGSPIPPHVLPRAPQKEVSEGQQPPAHNPQPSAPSKSHLLAGLSEGAPAQGANGSGQFDQATAAAAAKEQVSEGPGKLLEEAAEEDLLEGEAEPSPLEMDPAGQTVGTEPPGSHPGEAEAEGEADDYMPEEQLEDENALSARQARASEMQDRPQGPGGTVPGALRNVLEIEGHREETGRKSEMGGPRGDATGRAPGAFVAPEEARTFTGPGAQKPSMGQDAPSTETRQPVPEVAATRHMVGSEPGQGGRSEENPGPSRELTDVGGLEATPPPGPDDPAHWPPQHLPIIGSFFKDQQSWQRFQEHLKVPELEALLQDLSVRLMAAQRESLPYNAEKALDKVFRAAEAHILSVAEQMLDARGSDGRDSEIFEEAAVLDDVQDLIYFVRYQHPMAGLPAPPVTLPPPGDAWEEPMKELQPPTEGDFSQGKIEDMLVPEPELTPGEPSLIPGEPSLIPGEPSLTPGEPSLNPGEPSLIPGEPSLTPGEPSLTPGEPSLTPGEPSLTPGEPSLTPGEPSLTPGEPSLIPGEPSLTPGEPSLIPGEPSLIPGEPSPMDPPESSTPVASELFPEPSPEEDTDAGMLVPESFPVDAVGADKQLVPDTEEPTRATPLDSVARLIYSCVACVTRMLVATLPEDLQPGPDFYGLPWQPVLATAFLGVASFVLFWRVILEVKSKTYQVTEQQISEKVKSLRKENTELAQELSNYEQKVKESKKLAQETKKLSVMLSDQAVKYEDKIKKLEESNEALNGTAKSLRDQLESERVQNAKNQDLILEKKKSIKKLKDVISMSAAELSEVQIALNETKLCEEKVKSEYRRVQEENARLRKKEEQLQQEIKEWSKSHYELSEQIKSFAQTQKDLEVTLNHHDDDISALSNCITQLNRLDCESEPESQNSGGNVSDELANGEVAGGQHEKLKSRIKQMMDVSRTRTAVAVVEEDLKLLQSKLRASMSTKSNLEDQIKKLEGDRSSLLLDKSGLEEECKALRQKVEILNELYQEKEMLLQKKLSQEEYERHEREQLLSAADEKADLAAEEVKTYKRRIEEMEEELMKTERSFKNQIAAHEKKAHENWLKARAAERAMAEEKRESANLRHKLLEMTQKMAMLQEEPVIVKPLPGRPSTHNPPRRGPLSQNGSFGPSPVSGGECSPPPPPMTEPPARPLSATTLSRREAPRSEFDAASGASPMMNNSSRSSSPSRALDEGKVSVAMKVPPPFPGMPLLGGPMGGPPPPPARYGPQPPLGRPFGPRPIPPILSPFGPGLCPPLGIREYVPGVPPGKRDGPYDPREFVPGHAPFRPSGPLGPREYFIPGSRLPPPPHGPQDYPLPPRGPQDYPPPPHGAQDYPPPPHGPQNYPPPPHGAQDYPPPPHGAQDYLPPSAARDFPPSGSRDEALHASQGGSPSSSQALRQSP